MEKIFHNFHSSALVCHGLGAGRLAGNDSSSSISEGGSSSSQQVLVMSEVGKPSGYLCLAYTEVEGRLEASLSYKKCTNNDPLANVSSSGPCILPLTQDSGDMSSSSFSSHTLNTLSLQITACLALVSRQLV